MLLEGNSENTLPRIEFKEKEGIVNISGRSLSTEVFSYFSTFLAYFKEYVQKSPSDLIVTFELEYFNTKSAQALMTFFKIINSDIIDAGCDASINWIIEKDDEGMHEVIEDFIQLTKLNFKVIEKSKEN